MTEATYSVENLLRVMQRLRDPQQGCPWDLRQDFNTIVPSTLEECYELAEAIEQGDFDHVAEELGDVLFQVIFYSQLGAEQGLFSFDTIVATLVEKLIRRHPHVFADGELEGVVTASTSVEEVKRSWEAIKQDERKGKNKGGVLDDVPLALPALPRAQKLQKRAAQVGFDWQDPASVLDKLSEEINELRAAMASGDAVAIKDELGDVFFTGVNLARHLGLDAEDSLRHSSAKFERRFRLIDALAQEEGHALSALDEEQMDRLWKLAKARG